MDLTGRLSQIWRNENDARLGRREHRCVFGDAEEAQIASRRAIERRDPSHAGRPFADQTSADNLRNGSGGEDDTVPTAGLLSRGTDDHCRGGLIGGFVTPAGALGAPLPASAFTFGAGVAFRRDTILSVMSRFLSAATMFDAPGALSKIIA